MPRHFTAAAMISAAAAALAFASAPAALAQDADERVNQLIIYGDDPCPASAEGDITVCARKPESERFRIPEPLRETGELQKNESWTTKVLAYETVGKAGAQSCSPVGAGGWTGCAARLIDRAYAERAQSSDVRFSELIQAERERRLATIDEEAAETQARVEEAERAYEARQRAARETELPDMDDPEPAADPPLLPTELPPGA